jgi:hypothetical protein
MTDRARGARDAHPHRLSLSADGSVTTPHGWPPLVADRAFVPGKTHGFASLRLASARPVEGGAA